ncbi:uncharacterized protein LOC126298232 [Schistocerca gregaria]|uniref:uncharacterized protein LOC126298232 n=1 Tax=Schistocerca gregaria TaxID=7010 RepID=UPI00211EAFEE|nr:uncharacterized protein LOC126298232 [Schistocerca gregaria]
MVASMKSESKMAAQDSYLHKLSCKSTTMRSVYIEMVHRYISDEDEDEASKLQQPYDTNRLRWIEMVFDDLTLCVCFCCGTARRGAARQACVCCRAALRRPGSAARGQPGKPVVVAAAISAWPWRPRRAGGSFLSRGALPARRTQADRRHSPPVRATLHSLPPRRRATSMGLRTTIPRIETKRQESCVDEDWRDISSQLNV